MKLYNSLAEREQAVLVGAAITAFAFLVHDGALSDERIDAAFNIAERFLKKAEARVAKVPGAAP